MFVFTIRGQDLTSPITLVSVCNHFTICYRDLSTSIKLYGDLHEIIEPPAAEFDFHCYLWNSALSLIIFNTLGHRLLNDILLWGNIRVSVVILSFVVRAGQDCNTLFLTVVSLQELSVPLHWTSGIVG